MSNANGLRKAGVVLAIAMFASAPAWAQTGLGTIVGTVTDASTKQPVVDVVVTATAPSLPGEQIVVTDAQGQFRIPQLPAGSYTLRFEKESYRPFSRAGIPLRIDTTVRVNTEILPETAGETEIVVVGKAPTIDVGSTQIGVNVGGDFVRNLAVIRPTGKGGATRSFESLAAVAPGANGDDYGVGISGTTSPENSYIIDGLSVNDPAFGLLGTPMSVEFVQEVNVITGGYMPEYGRTTGGVLNAVTKSGSNEFHGSVFATWTPGVLQAKNRVAALSLATVNTQSEGHNIGDFGATLGGPILKDKLWFFAGFNPSFQRSRVTGIYSKITGINVDPDTGAETPSFEGGEFARQSRFRDARNFQFIGKLTYAVNQDHTLNLSVWGAPSSSGSATSFPFDAQTGGGLGSFSADYGAASRIITSTPIDVSLKINNAFMDKRVLLDTTLGWHHQEQSELPVDGSTIDDTLNGNTLAGRSAVSYSRTRANSAATGMRARDFYNLTDFIGAEHPLYDAVVANCSTPTADSRGALNSCPVTAWTQGGPGFINDDRLDRLQGKSVATFIFDALGSHAAKAGLDVEFLSYDRKKAYTGTRFLQQLTNGRDFIEQRNFAFLSGPGLDTVQYNAVTHTTPTSLTLGGFLQDSWSVMDVFTVNVGVRYDAQTVTGADGKIGLALPNQWSPRVGVIYDPTQQGRAKLFANYARFFESVPLNIGDRAFGGERSVAMYRSGAGCDPLNDPSQATATGACGDSSNIIPGQFAGDTDPNEGGIITLSGDRATVDPNLRPQSSDEFIAGGEYQVIENGRIGAQYTKRYMNSVIEDMSRDEATTYFIGNPGEGIAKDFPKATRDYDAVNVYFTKDFADLWMAQASYTWSRLHGNWAGLYRPETLQLDPNINSDFDLQSLLPNREGFLPGDRTHVLKLYGAKEFVFGGNMSVNLGLSYRFMTGTPLNVLGAHEIYRREEVFILPRGSAGRLPVRHDIDGHLAFNVKLSEVNTVSVGVDVFNIFNWGAVAERNQEYTRAFVLPVQDPNANLENVDSLLTYSDGTPFDPSDKDPNFGNNLAFQAARNVRLMARFTF